MVDKNLAHLSNSLFLRINSDDDVNDDDINSLIQFLFIYVQKQHRGQQS
jgi:hemerythrin-like domain-containing protein